MKHGDCHAAFVRVLLAQAMRCALRWVKILKAATIDAKRQVSRRPRPPRLFYL
jgi:hypothetical protein